MLTESRLFARYGHRCEIPTVPGDLPMFLKGGNVFERFRNRFIRFRMASELHVEGHKVLRSFRAIVNEHRKQLDYVYIIHPFSDFRFYWEVFMALIFAVLFMLIPMDVAIYVTGHYETVTAVWVITHAVLDLICIADAVLNFLTGYCKFSTREVILEPRRIVIHYLKSYFIIDVVSSLCGEINFLMNPSFVAKSIKLFALMKLFRIFTFIRYCLQFTEHMGFNYTRHQVAMIVFCYTLYVHVVTCTNIYLMETGKMYNIHSYKWQLVSSSYPDGLRFNEVYAMNMYTALKTINNMGFGLPPTHTKLRIYIMVVWILSKVVQIFLIANIMKLVVTTRSAHIKYIEMVRQLKEYMRYKNIPDSLQSRLLVYYEFRFQKSYFRESEILTTITGLLREELLLHSCRKLVEHVDFLNHLPKSLLTRIVSSMIYEVFLVNDVIFKVNTPGYCMYFIITGSVAIYTRTGREVCHLSDGGYFGEIALLLPKTTRTGSVVAVEICELYRLDRRDFLTTIGPHADLVNYITKIGEKRKEAIELFETRNEYEKTPLSQ